MRDVTRRLTWHLCPSHAKEMAQDHTARGNYRPNKTIATKLPNQLCVETRLISNV